MSTVFVLGRDDVGAVAEDRSMTPPFRYYLTDCCGASAKGMEWGIGCRACYDEIDPALGGTPGSATRLRPGGDPTRFSDYEYVEVPLDLVEVYGDGIPYDEWRARRRHPAANVGRVPRRYDRCDETCTVDCGHCKGTGVPPLSAYVVDASRLIGFGDL